LVAWKLDMGDDEMGDFDDSDDEELEIYGG
jgi:hypothetical protein